VAATSPAREALAFVERHGVVLVSAMGDAPRLVEAIAGAPIRGNWWTHPRARFIFAVLSQVVRSDDVLACRLLDGKVTLVHRRLWPALLRVADRFDRAQLAHLREEHLPSGRHATTEVPFPAWVPADVRAQALLLDEEQAMAALGAAVSNAQRAPKRRSNARRRARA
jgi:hypothetical protein